MSACLFMIDHSYLTHKKEEEIKALIEFWENSSNNPDPSNKFECDRAGGFQMNINIAKYELECRAAKTTAHSISYRINHEMIEGAPNVRKALMDASSKGTGYLRLNNINPDKWFEYVTEEQLKKDLGVK